MSPTVIMLVRHGHVENPDNILYGRLPGFPLSAQGIEQARTTARRLRKAPLVAVFSSPLVRCRQTAREIIAYHPGLRLCISKRITEVLTVYEGYPAEVIDKLGGDIYTNAPSGFEQPEHLIKRIRLFLNSVRRKYPGKQVVAVTHGDIIAFTVLWARGFALTPENKQRLADAGIKGGYPAHASVTRLCYTTDSPEELPRITYMPLPPGKK